jgi:hypothetical protein
LRRAVDIQHPGRGADEEEYDETPRTRSEKAVGNPTQRQSDAKRSQEFYADTEAEAKPGI